MTQSKHSLRLVALTSAAALGMGALIAAPAQAATGPKDYTCTLSLLGAQTFSVDTDTDAPASVYLGQSFTPTITSKVTLPAELVDAMRNAGIGKIDGTADADSYKNGVKETAKLSFARTDVPAAVGSSMVIEAKGAATAATPTATGAYTLGSGNFNTTLKLYNADGTPYVLPQETATCTSDGVPHLADTVDVKAAVASTTTLAVEPASAAYGAAVKATATVKSAVAELKPAGSVDFKVGDTTVKGTVDANGVATADIPFQAVGTHAITASYTLTTGGLTNSVSAPANLTVVKDDTTATAKASVKKKAKKVVIKVKVKSANGQTPDGKVKLVVKKGKKKVLKKAVTVNKKGVAKLVIKGKKFKKMKKGKYKVNANYTGSSNFNKSKAKAKFKI